MVAPERSRNLCEEGAAASGSVADGRHALADTPEKQRRRVSEVARVSDAHSACG
jgi:hypothetical protein